MCNDCFDANDPFAGLDTGEFEREMSRPAPAPRNTYSEPAGDIAIPGFVEKCPKCRGTGNWRPGFPCFKCKGKGTLQFRTAPQARAKARVNAKARTERKSADNVAAFKAEFPVEAAWLISNSHGNTFADSLRQAVEKYGHLTDGQMAAVRKGIAREADALAGVAVWAEHNAAEHAWLTAQADGGNEFAASLLKALTRFGSLTEGQLAAVRRNLAKEPTGALASDLDISSLKGYYAVPNGDTRLKICVRKPGANSRYHGWTFVDDGAEYGSRRTYGRQAPNGTYTGEIQDALRAILADPMAAQVAYGHLTGVCGRCGRILEDEESVAAGIGPICATKI